MIISRPKTFTILKLLLRLNYFPNGSEYKLQASLLRESVSVLYPGMLNNSHKPFFESIEMRRIKCSGHMSFLKWLLNVFKGLLCLTRCSQGLMGCRVPEERVTGEYWSGVLWGCQITSSENACGVSSHRDAAARGTRGAWLEIKLKFVFLHANEFMCWRLFGPNSKIHSHLFSLFCDANGVRFLPLLCVFTTQCSSFIFRRF